MADELGGEVLDLEEAFLELLRFEKIARAGVAQGGRGGVGFRGAKSEGRRAEIGGRGVAEGAGDGGGEFALGADPEGGRALELAEVGEAGLG